MATVEELAASTPTLEDLLFSVSVQSWTGDLERDANFRMCILAAPFPLRVLSVDLAFEYCTVPASDSSYWTCALEKGTGPTGWPDITSKSTQNTGALANGGISPRVAWSLESGSWGNADLAKGELLALNWMRTGSPANLKLPLLVTVRYRPL